MEKDYYAPAPGSFGHSQRVREAQKQALNQMPASAHSGGPLPSLAEQLMRLDGLRSRVGALAERVIGPRGLNEGLTGAPTVYGGIIGALEGETLTLRQRIDEMHRDLDAIEAALS